MSIWSDERAQVSAEMLVVLAVLIGIAIFMANNLMGTAEKQGDAVSRRSDKIIEELDKF